MHKETSSLPAEVQQPVAVLQSRSIYTSINGTQYLLESRVLQLDTFNRRSEYRVWLGERLIKDWSEGDIEQYFQL